MVLLILDLDKYFFPFLKDNYHIRNMVYIPDRVCVTGDFTNIHDTDKNNDQTENSNFLITKSYVTIDPTILSEVTAEITIPSMQSS